MSTKGTSGSFFERVRARLKTIKSEMATREQMNTFSAENSKFITVDSEHLTRTLTWIARAQDATGDGGVSRGNSIIPSPKANAKGWQPSYPETTGYIIPTLIQAGEAQSDTSLFERAKRMGEWELAIQRPDGSVHGGNIAKPAGPAVFDTGQVLRGYLALYERTKEQKYLDAAVRAISWMTSVEHNMEGRWISGNPTSVDAHMTTYMVYAIAPIAEWGVRTNNDEWKALARRAGDATLRAQMKNGWFDECDFWDKERPLLHTIGYTIDGLWDIGEVLGEEKFVLGAKRALDAVLLQMDERGHISGRLDREWKGTVDWACLTGIAQIGVTAMKAYKKFGDEKYKQKAELAKDFLKTCQNNFDEKFGGGVGALWGSWPISGGYQGYQSLNWAAKYFADLLLALDEDKKTAS